MSETKRVLIIAKTDPNPSKKYGSTVCTAGITDDGQFIRLYPIPYRLFCSDEGGFSKYDWIECECEKSTDDKRPESYKVKEGSIKVVGHLDCDLNWKRRNEIVLPKVVNSIKELEDEGLSLGIVRPTEVMELVRTSKTNKYYEESASDYRKVLQMIFDEQGNVRKIPKISDKEVYYRYSFKCGDESHKLMCEDWEIYQAAHSWLDRYGSPDVTWDKMHEKFFDIFTSKRDLHFFVGTHFLWGTWIIIGLYYPPKIISRGQKSLFDDFD